jgi:hypothetical protein
MKSAIDYTGTNLLNSERPSKKINTSTPALSDTPPVTPAEDLHQLYSMIGVKNLYDTINDEPNPLIYPAANLSENIVSLTWESPKWYADIIDAFTCVHGGKEMYKSNMNEFDITYYIYIFYSHTGSFPKYFHPQIMDSYFTSEYLYGGSSTTKAFNKFYWRTLSDGETVTIDGMNFTKVSQVFKYDHFSEPGDLVSAINNAELNVTATNTEGYIKIEANDVGAAGNRIRTSIKTLLKNEPYGRWSLLGTTTSNYYRAEIAKTSHPFGFWIGAKHNDTPEYIIDSTQYYMATQ